MQGWRGTPSTSKQSATKSRTKTHSSDKDITAAFIKHNLITEAGGRVEEAEKGRRIERRRPVSKEAMAKTLKALGKTKNKSAAGPDGTSWRLLKLIKGTGLLRAVLEDVSVWATPEENIKVPEAARQMTMVMIAKPDKVHT